MAKAGGNTNTTWILLLDARALAIEAYDGAVKKAERFAYGVARRRAGAMVLQAIRASVRSGSINGEQTQRGYGSSPTLRTAKVTPPSGAPASISTGRRTGRTRCT